MISFIKFQKPNGKWMILDCRGEWTLFDKLIVIADDIEEGPAEQLCAWLEQMAEYERLFKTCHKEMYELTDKYHVLSNKFENIKESVDYINEIVDEEKDGVLIFREGHCVYMDD